MKKLLAMLLALVMVLSFAACNQPTAPVESEGEPAVEPTAEELLAQRVEELKAKYPVSTEAAEPTFAPDVQAAIDALVATYGVNSENYKEDTYVVFDFDNTCSIFDVEEQLAIYQLQVMAFAITPEELPGVLETQIGMKDDGTQDLVAERECYSVDEISHGYQDWIDDITAAYTYLYGEYGPFTAAGLDAEQQTAIQADPQWLEFATKMRAMYDVVYDSESAAVAYPWVLYWFTGMTEDEVYALATASHSTYKAVETSSVNWTTPEDIESKVGVVSYDWTSGTQVSESVKELWKVLDENGIDVWVCSASATDPIRAAIDVWDLHQYCTGMIAMTNKVVDGKYVNEYDYETGCGWLANEDGTWTRDTAPIKAQTQGVGKVTSIVNAISPKYNNHGPIAGFMDSTGDFNFCTEFKTLKLVIDFNRASRKVTDGGGVIAELAIYQRDTLGYDFATADAAGDTLYVLQGREENGLRSLRNHTMTMTLGATEEKMFKNDDNWTQLLYIIDNSMTTEDVINTFAMKTAADDEGNVLGFKYGFLKEYAGYHSHE